MVTKIQWAHTIVPIDNEGSKAIRLHRWEREQGLSGLWPVFHTVTWLLPDAELAEKSPERLQKQCCRRICIYSMNIGKAPALRVPGAVLSPRYNRTQDIVCSKGRGVLVCTESAWRRCWSRLSASNSNAYVSQADAMCVLGTGQQEMVGTVAKRRGRVLWRAAPSPSCCDGQPEEMPAQGYHIWISNRSWKSSSCGISHLEKHCVGQTAFENLVP